MCAIAGPTGWIPVQVTDTVGRGSASLSSPSINWDGTLIALRANVDGVPGRNPDGSEELLAAEDGFSASASRNGSPCGLGCQH